MRTLRPDLLIAVTSKSGLRADILARASSWMAMSKRVEWIMPVYSAAAVSTLRVRVPANMGWFLLDWPVPDVIASTSGIAFSTPHGIAKQKACFPFLPYLRLSAED